MTRSDAQNFLKSLYSFLALKQLLEIGGEDNNNRTLNMTLQNNFVNELTSLVATKKDGKLEAGQISPVEAWGNN